MVDDEYFVAGGEFINSANISGINLTSSTGGNDESWVAMFDTSGAGVWANKATNTGFNAVQSLAVDGDGYIYSGGYFEGTTDFEGDTSLTSNGDRDMYLVKYSPMAQLIWARSAGGTQFDQLRKVVANDSNEKIHVIGAFQETLTITPTDEIVSNGNYDVAILSVTNDGDLDWYEGIGGTENDQGYGLYNDAEGRVYASGFFSGSLLLDGETLTPSGPNDALVVKISPCEFPSLGFNTSVAQELCEGEELGVTLFNTETNVLYTIYADDEEADSDTQGLIELYLEVDEDDLEVGTNNITFGLLKEGCADEVFLDTTFLTEVYASPEADFSHMETSGMSDFTDLSTCSDAITAWEWDIEGDIYTSQNLSLSLSNDDYEVCLTVTSEFGCIDEACETITVLTGVQEYGGRSLNLRYDATNELLSWDSSGPLTVEVYDMSGRLVFGQYVNNQVDVSGLKRQMYVLRLLQKNELLVTGKFIK